MTNFKRTRHFYKGYKILKIWECEQVGYRVQGMPEEFYKMFWDGIFDTLKDSKKYIDKFLNDQN